MKLLLDTHAFLWWASEPEKLTEKALLACQDSENMVILSVASVWEMQIKTELAKLRIGGPIEELIRKHQQTNGLQILPIELAHVLALNGLPYHHKDPFDRPLIAQANAEDATLVTADRMFSGYSVKLLW